jgi:hypothetical protein
MEIPERLKKRNAWVLSSYEPFIAAQQQLAIKYGRDGMPDAFPLCKRNVSSFFTWLGRDLVYAYSSITVY